MSQPSPSMTSSSTRTYSASSGLQSHRGGHVQEHVGQAMDEAETAFEVLICSMYKRTVLKKYKK